MDLAFLALTHTAGETTLAHVGTYLLTSSVMVSFLYLVGENFPPELTHYYYFDIINLIEF